MPGSAEIVVIGAGAAGLAAACELQRSGIEVVIVEARPRCGGRILTHREAGLPLPIELGAEFVHGRAIEVASLARKAGATICDIHGARYGIRGGRLRPITDFWRSLDHIMSLLPDDPREDCSFQQFLDTRPGGRRLARSRKLAAQFVAGFHAADLSRISAAALAAEGSPHDDKRETRTGRVLDGYDRLTDYLAAELRGRILLRHVVQRIDWRRGGVTVECATTAGSLSRRIEARAAVITVPIGVLQAAPTGRGAIAFSPPLDAKASALACLAMGSVVRVAVRFRERFWAIEQTSKQIGDAGLDRLSFLHGNDEHFPVWWTTYPIHSPVLVAWCGGWTAQALAARTAADIEAVALRALARQFRLTRRVADSLVEGFWTHDWQHDPFARGAYSYPAVGGREAAAALARPLQGTLYFAGEATDTQGATATVHGALASGYRAARQLRRALYGRSR